MKQPSNPFTLLSFCFSLLILSMIWTLTGCQKTHPAPPAPAPPVDELEILRSQIGTSSWGGSRYMPMAFTEQGVAMLSSVPNSARAIKVNVQIIRIFTRMREMLLTHKDILLKLEQLENQIMLNPPEEPRPRIGFRRKDEQE